MFFRKPTNQKPGSFEASGAGRSGGQDRRRSPRIQSAILSCELGQVVDISRKGVRVSANQPPPRTASGSPIGLVISSPTDLLELTARVVRIRNRDGRYEIALDFAPMTDAQADAVEAIAKTGSTRFARHTDAARRERIIAAMKIPDHYAALGVAPEAPVLDVQRAYRALARRFHPDVNKDPGAHHRFIEINEAHTVLCNPEARAEYDRVCALRRAA